MLHDRFFFAIICSFYKNRTRDINISYETKGASLLVDLDLIVTLLLNLIKKEYCWPGDFYQRY